MGVLGGAKDQRQKSMGKVEAILLSHILGKWGGEGEGVSKVGWGQCGRVRRGTLGGLSGCDRESRGPRSPAPDVGVSSTPVPTPVLEVKTLLSEPVGP